LIHLSLQVPCAPAAVAVTGGAGRDPTRLASWRFAI
jgi:hypothetical protein